MTSLATADTFCWPVRVYWEDTDAGGIVFYANYLKFFERARTEWLRSLGVQQQRLREDTGGMFVVSGTELRYHRPARLDDLLQVTARVGELGRASMTLQQEAWLTQDGERSALLCEGSIRIGWVQADEMRPGRIPQPIINVLQPR
ncbi:tol-pal system-associated acyl-CoA thioesterase [Hydrogenophaga aquatica]